MTINIISKKDVPHTQYYDSAYMAETLDSAFDIEHDGFDDGTLYWDMLQELLRVNRSQLPHSYRTIVLDVGAGSGRIFRKIAQKATKSGDDLSDATFIGLDKSSAMLERAKKRAFELSGVGTVSWLVGDAKNLLAQPTLREARRQVSLVLCADGGIGYLDLAKDIDAFFLHVAQLLRPGSGRAHISLLEFQVAEAYDNGTTPSIYDESMESMDEASKDTALTFKVVVHREYVEDGHHLAQLDTEIIETDKQGKETLLEVCHYSHRFRIWRTEELIQVAKKAGLQHVETIKWPRMQHFVFMVPELN
ncbi:uncharacterized protein GIQ15_01731 [Arthroderma uncinatum]|uniref:uncharacterized protein n=1 Tax=Arthroderma uncinatum TaxID=74035 RepID=UPI00144A687D|nr:uncharacterized protein GIQ15_01731 [Arthroderma uncinatum]KAF3492214.1 hypothetical protein GIQ15_01731 [Arthroderma uncinatum]